jgi:hypothetical protein
MLQFFKQLFDRARMRRALAALDQWDPPADPTIPVREPRRRPPTDRGTTVAVAEPDPPQFVSAAGRLRPERGAKSPRESVWGWGPKRTEKSLRDRH